MGGGNVFLIESGCLIMEAALPGNRRQIVMLLYPGDVVAHEMVPPAPSMTITAVVASVLRRIDASSPDKRGPLEIAAAAGPQLARAGLHCVTLGRLTGEERVATALLEMSYYLGREVTNGRAFDLPLSRRDLADYLALNPDTLSRIVSRFKVGHLVTTINRRQMLVTDVERLAALSPLGDAFVRPRAGVPASQDAS